ncbi:MAG: NAD-dependent epimerase/dehydratase family protein [Bacteroidetes bacterium]|nr:NAD-dependent epimerase/dehydratase family protein [Bacteroidota bacterium]
MTCFVTGASGFIGSNLVLFLKQVGIDSFAIDKHSLKQKKFPILSGAVIHLAGKAHDLKSTSLIEEYNLVNFELTKGLFDEFLKSEAEVFVFISSIKVLDDKAGDFLDERCKLEGNSPYGVSKRIAEEYILTNGINSKKRIYILRPCIVYGKGHRGNLELLNKFVKFNLPWPLGSFDNCRSFCSVDNLNFVISELIKNKKIDSGIYHIADDGCISTNDLIKLIGAAQNKRIRILNLNKKLVRIIARIGDKFNLPFNSSRLEKLTYSLKVSNAKIKAAIGQPLPVKINEGLTQMFSELQS